MLRSCRRDRGASQYHFAHYNLKNFLFFFLSVLPFHFFVTIRLLRFVFWRAGACVRADVFLVSWFLWFETQLGDQARVLDNLDQATVNAAGGPNGLSPLHHCAGADGTPNPTAAMAIINIGGNIHATVSHSTLLYMYFLLFLFLMDDGYKYITILIFITLFSQQKKCLQRIMSGRPPYTRRQSGVL